VKCPFGFSISGVASCQIDKDHFKTIPLTWTMANHGLSKASFQHERHPFRGTSTMLNDEVRTYLLQNAEDLTVTQLRRTVRARYSVFLEDSQVRYFLRSNNVHASESRAGRESGSGNALDTMKFLLKSKNSKVTLALIDVQTGKWHTGNCSLPQGSVDVKITLHDYKDHDPRLNLKPISNPDPDRCVSVDGRVYFVHIMAWNYISSALLFAAYPWTLAMDVQAHVTRTTDGFNCIGQDGNNHNIVVMRAYIHNQRAETFRWLLRVAFPELVINFAAIRAFFVDGWEATLTELRAVCQAEGLFPLARIIRCMWHLLTDAYDRQFGYASASTWFTMFKSLFYRIRNCEHEPEFRNCSQYVLRLGAANNAAPGDSPFPSADMVKFVLSRLDNCEDWVLMHHLCVPTRGTSTTQRVEADQGHSRDHDINARNSWLLTSKKHDTAHHEQLQALLVWSDKQIGRALCRGPTNAEITTLTQELLEKLDSIALPWCVDNMEVQLLLGQNEEMRCVFRSRHHLSSGGSRYVFNVFYEDDDADAEDRSDVAADPVGMADVEVSSDDQETSSDGASGHQKKKKKSNAVGEDEWSESHAVPGVRSSFEYTEEMDEDFKIAMSNPLPQGTKFSWKKVRTISVIPNPRDATSVLLVCDCGFPCRIGFACRHIFCFLIKIFKAILVNLHNDTEFAWAKIPNFDFEDLFNMDICSKIKYHAVLRDKSGEATKGFASLSDLNKFHPKMSACLFTQYVRNVRNFEPETGMHVPIPGLPDGSCLDNDGAHDADARTNSRPQQQTARRRESSRERVPTKDHVDHEMDEIWQWTTRIKDRDKQLNARILIGSTVASLKDQIRSLHPDTAPRKLNRYMSKSDLYKGRNNDR
jgi:hypothetical protein